MCMVTGVVRFLKEITIIVFLRVPSKEIQCNTDVFSRSKFMGHTVSALF